MGLQRVYTGDLRADGEFSSVSATGVTHEAHTEHAGSGRVIATGQNATDALVTMTFPSTATGTWRGLFKLGQVENGHDFFRIRAADAVNDDSYAVKRFSGTRMDLVIEAAGGDVLLGSVTLDDDFTTGGAGPVVWVEVSIDDVGNTWRLRAVALGPNASVSPGKLFDASGSSASLEGNRDAMILIGVQGAGSANSIAKGWQFIASDTVNHDLGPHLYLQTARPSGDGTPLEWATVGAGATHAARVAEAFPHDGDTTGVQATGDSLTVPKTMLDRLSLGDVSAPIAGGVANQVLGIFAGYAIRNQQAVVTGDSRIRIIDGAGGTLVESALFTPGAIFEVHANAAIDTTARTKATVDGYSVELVAVVLSTETIRCTAAWAVFVVDSTAAALDTAAGAELDLPLRDEADPAAGVETVTDLVHADDVDPAAGAERDDALERADDVELATGAEVDDLERLTEGDVAVGAELDAPERAEADASAGTEGAEALDRVAEPDAGTGAERDERVAREEEADLAAGVEADVTDRTADVDPASGVDADATVVREAEFDLGTGLERDEPARDNEGDVAAGAEPFIDVERAAEPDAGAGVEVAPAIEREAHTDVGDGVEQNDALERGPHGDEATGADVGGSERDGFDTGQGFEDQAVLLQQVPTGIVVSSDNGGGDAFEANGGGGEFESGQGGGSFESGGSQGGSVEGGGAGGGGVEG